MWIVATYQPISLFSLRPAMVTSSGGKTLLVPTPYAIKMALLDTAIRTQGLQKGSALFPAMRDLELQLEAPTDIIVMKSFSKIRRLLKDGSNPEKAERARLKKDWPLQATIAYREYVQYQGTMRLACKLDEKSSLIDLLPTLLMHINYLGKRGGFLQIVEAPIRYEDLPEGNFRDLTAKAVQSFTINGTLQMLDDCNETLSFERCNIYNGKQKITLGKERVLRHVVLPHHVVRSSRSYSWYQA